MKSRVSMKSLTCSTLVLLAGALAIISCGQGSDSNCPEGMGGAGSSGSGPSSGTSGSGGGCGDTQQACTDLQNAITTCISGWCAGAGSSTAECGCWNQGMDLSEDTCTCVPQDLGEACEVYNLCTLYATTYDCTAATEALQNTCMQ